MTSIATITASTTAPELDPAGRGEHHFTVTNVTDRRIRFGFKVVPESAPQGTVFGEGDDLMERDLDPNETTVVTVHIRVPEGALPATYSLRLRAYDTTRPGDLFTEGPTEHFVVVGGGTATPAQRKFPWLIVAVVAIVVILGGAVVVYFLRSDDGGAAAVEVPGVPLACDRFNPEDVEISASGGQWMLTAGDAYSMDFPDEAEARTAGRIIDFHNIDTRCSIGGAAGGNTFYLSGGAMPSGAMPGEDCLRHDLNRVRVEQVGGRWKIVENGHWMMDFADREEQANNVFRVLQHFGVDAICYVGRPDPSMVYMRQ